MNMKLSTNGKPLPPLVVYTNEEDDPRRNKRVPIAFSAKEKKLVAKAARYSHMSFSQFAAFAALFHAKGIIKEREGK